MRVAPSRYVVPKPMQLKKSVAKVQHVGAPINGLNLYTRSGEGDPQSAPILTNFTVEEDRISCRAGYVLQSTHADAKSIAVLIPWYGQNPKLLAATNHKLADALTGADRMTGFTSDDWSWTSFANLGVAKFTVMVNGADGVWSWDGGSTPAGPVVAVTAVSKANPAVVTVGAADIGNFSNGQNVLIAGATGTFALINGNHVIGNVGTPVNSFSISVDTSAVTGSLNAGVTAQPQGSFVKENVTAPSSATWINPNQFNIVLSHQNRLFFADTDNLAVYYLPLMQKFGEVKYLPMNALFRRGGTIRAMYTWSVDGGTNPINAQLVVFTSNGECAIYAGTDPDTAGAWGLVGLYRFDAPLSKRALANWGGDLYVMTSTGVVPMTTLMRAEADKLGSYDKAVMSFFYEHSVSFRTFPGWQVMVNPWSNRLICNVPHGPTNQYHQLVRTMPQPVWSEWEDIPSRSWGWVDPYVYFGDDSGHVYRSHPSIRSDNGAPITVDVQGAWSQFQWDGLKQFKLIRAHISTDGNPNLQLDVKTDYDFTDPVNQPDITTVSTGASWNTATWDVDYWAGGEAPKPMQIWQGAGALGVVGAPRLRARIKDATFDVFGFDIVCETGSILR